MESKSQTTPADGVSKAQLVEEFGALIGGLGDGVERERLTVGAGLMGLELGGVRGEEESEGYGVLSALGSTLLSWLRVMLFMFVYAIVTMIPLAIVGAFFIPTFGEMWEPLEMAVLEGSVAEYTAFALLTLPVWYALVRGVMGWDKVRARLRAAWPFGVDAKSRALHDDAAYGVLGVLGDDGVEVERTVLEGSALGWEFRRVGTGGELLVGLYDRDGAVGVVRARSFRGREVWTKRWVEMCEAYGGVVEQTYDGEEHCVVVRFAWSHEMTRSRAGRRACVEAMQATTYHAVRSLWGGVESDNQDKRVRAVRAEAGLLEREGRVRLETLEERQETDLLQDARAVREGAWHRWLRVWLGALTQKVGLVAVVVFYVVLIVAGLSAEDNIYGKDILIASGFAGALLVEVVRVLPLLRRSPPWGRHRQELWEEKHFKVAYDGKGSLSLGGSEVRLDRPWGVSLTQSCDEEGRLWLGVDVAQSEGEVVGGRVRFRVAVEASAWLESLPVLDMEAPKVHADAFRDWIWPLLHAAATVHGVAFVKECTWVHGVQTQRERQGSEAVEVEGVNAGVGQSSVHV